jgi:hypothetical protein
MTASLNGLTNRAGSIEMPTQGITLVGFIYIFICGLF